MVHKLLVSHVVALAAHPLWLGPGDRTSCGAIGAIQALGSACRLFPAFCYCELKPDSIRPAFREANGLTPPYPVEIIFRPLRLFQLAHNK
jgi:hypothetical protein